MARRVYDFTGTEGLEASWQEPFDSYIKCPYCDGTADIAFVRHEDFDESEECEEAEDIPCFICDIRDNAGKLKELWPHDCCSIAVYICGKCMGISGRMTQS